MFERKVLSFPGCDKGAVRNLLAINRVMLHTTNTASIQLQYIDKKDSKLSAVIRIPINGTNDQYNLLSVVKFTINKRTTAGAPSKIGKTGRLTTMFISRTSSGESCEKLGSKLLIKELGTARDTVYHICYNLLKHFSFINCPPEESYTLLDLAIKEKNDLINSVFRQLAHSNVNRSIQQQVCNAVNIFHSLNLNLPNINSEYDFPLMLDQVRLFVNEQHIFWKCNSNTSVIKAFGLPTPPLDASQTGLDVSNPCFLAAALDFFGSEILQHPYYLNSQMRQLIPIFKFLSDDIQWNNRNSKHLESIYSAIINATIGAINTPDTSKEDMSLIDRVRKSHASSKTRTNISKILQKIDERLKMLSLPPLLYHEEIQ